MQFDRVIQAKILITNDTYNGFTGEIDVRNLRITFNVTKTFSLSTNTASVRIYNLGPTNRNRLTGFGDQLRLFAGYRDQTGPELLFIGYVNKLNHTFAYPEIISTLECGDGERTLNNTTISISFGPKTPVRTVIEEIAARLDFTIAYLAPFEDPGYENGTYETALAKNLLDAACKKVNLRASVQNDNLIIIPDNGSTPKPAVEINAQTGMIGVPERYVDKRQYLYRAIDPNNPPKPGWLIRVLLRPDILPGDRIRVRSVKVDIDNELIVYSIRHQGDNYGPDFESIIEAFPA